MQVKILHFDNAFVRQHHLIEAKVSFQKYITYLREQIRKVDPLKANIYQYIIRKFETVPELGKTIDDIELLKEHGDIMNLVQATVFPLVSDETRNLFALSAPMSLDIFCYSDAMGEMLYDKKNNRLKFNSDQFLIGDVMEQREERLYKFLLSRMYGYDAFSETELIFPYQNEHTGLREYYRVQIDMRFVDVHCKGGCLPDISPLRVAEHDNCRMDLPTLRRELPLSGFVMEGFAIINIVDVTASHAVDEIKSKLLGIPAITEEAAMDVIGDGLRTLLQIRDLDVGLLPLLKVNDHFVLENEAHSASLLVRAGQLSGMTDSVYDDLAAPYENNPRPLIISSITDTAILRYPFLQLLKDAGYKGYMIMPIHYSSKLVGILELGARKADELEGALERRMEPVLVLLAQLLQYIIEKFNNRITQVIEDKFTSIQPSVEWKFREAAWHYIQRNPENGNGKMDIERIVFPGVFPIYGAIDIRNSTIERNAALQLDMQKQFDLLLVTLHKLLIIEVWPAAETLIEKGDEWLIKVGQYVTADDEVQLTYFFSNDVPPVLEHYEQLSSEASDVVNNYMLLTNPETGIVNTNRQQLESTIGVINTSLSLYLENEKKTLQHIYPSYFEKYRTDGLEYSLYLGQSLAPEQPFNLSNVREMRFWQLNAMARITLMTEEMQPYLPKPLHTTQLILAHSLPIDISFRNDERRFDVEGAYNIRYEIMKKRIDKVHIKGTDERLTQPGQVAIVYTTHQEAEEYKEYIHHLQEKHILGELEEIELEELQGISGLRALRVTVVR